VFLHNPATGSVVKPHVPRADVNSGDARSPKNATDANGGNVDEFASEVLP